MIFYTLVLSVMRSKFAVFGGYRVRHWVYKDPYDMILPLRFNMWCRDRWKDYIGNTLMIIIYYV